VVCQNCWLPTKRNQLQMEALYWWTLYSNCLLSNIQKSTFILRLAGITSSLLWYAKTGCQPTGLLEPSAHYGGMSEQLTPKEVNSIETVGRFLATSLSLPLVIFPTSLGWLILSAPQVVCQSYWLPVHRCARATSTLWWYARHTCSWRSSLYKKDK
jgi:hypothetical protein